MAQKDMGQGQEVYEESIQGRKEDSKNRKEGRKKKGKSCKENSKENLQKSKAQDKEGESRNKTAEDIHISCVLQIRNEAEKWEGIIL